MYRQPGVPQNTSAPFLHARRLDPRLPSPWRSTKIRLPCHLRMPHVPVQPSVHERSNLSHTVHAPALVTCVMTSLTFLEPRKDDLRWWKKGRIEWKVLTLHLSANIISRKATFLDRSLASSVDACVVVNPAVRSYSWA